MAGGDWRGMDRATLSKAYDNSGAVAGSSATMAALRARSAAFRERQAGALDLPYGEGERQRFDLFRCGRAGAPLLAFIHGGYWQRNDKHGFSALAEGRSPRPRRGDDRLHALPRGDDDGALRRDSGGALRLARPREPAAPRRVGLVGGGHLAALAMTCPEVDAGLAVSGIFDLAPIRRTALDDALHLTEDESRRCRRSGTCRVAPDRSRWPTAPANCRSCAGNRRSTRRPGPDRPPRRPPGPAGRRPFHGARPDDPAGRGADRGGVASRDRVTGAGSLPPRPARPKANGAATTARARERPGRGTRNRAWASTTHTITTTMGTITGKITITPTITPTDMGIITAPATSTPGELRPRLRDRHRAQHRLRADRGRLRLPHRFGGAARRCRPQPVGRARPRRRLGGGDARPAPADGAVHLRPALVLDPRRPVQRGVPAGRGRRHRARGGAALQRPRAGPGPHRDDRGAGRHRGERHHAWLFASGRKGDLNIRGAYLHMLADAAVSAGVVVAGLVILWTAGPGSIR